MYNLATATSKLNHDHSLLRVPLLIPRIVNLNLPLHVSASPALTFNLKSGDSLEAITSPCKQWLVATMTDNSGIVRYGSHQRNKLSQKIPELGGGGGNGPQGKEQGSRSQQRIKSERTKRSIDALKNKNEEIMKTDERHGAKSQTNFEKRL